MIEPPARLDEARRLDFPEMIAPHAGAAHAPRVGENVQGVVIAWRVTRAPSVRRSIDIGPLAHTRGHQRAL